jgi:tetratricopeptide (TPR) repeat protein
VVDQPEKEDVLDNKIEPSPVSFFNPEDWVDDEDDDQEMPGSGSDSIDYDQTEEEESQSVLNPAFQVSTKKVVRKQYWAVVFVILFGVLSALMVSRYFSLEEVNKFFIPVDEQELLQNSSVVKKHEKKIEKAKESSEKLLREFQTENEEKPIEEKPIEEKSIPKEDLIAQKNQERTSPGKMNVVSPKKSVYLENKPLSEKRKKSSKTTRRSELQKLPPMDPKRATREGWIKIEDQSYDSAKRIFLNVIEEQPNPKAFMGVGFAEERLADRYKERKDFARVEQQYDAAHKYYCAAMDYYTEQESMNEEDRFGLMYLQARLKTISRGCS